MTVLFSDIRGFTTLAERTDPEATVTTLNEFFTRMVPIVLAHGGTVGVYPEGTRSRDGLLHRGNLGPARLAAGSGAPIVPIGLVGTAEVQAPDQRVPRLGKHVTIRCGSPLRLEPSLEGDRTHLREATDALMAEIADLCGQEYVTTS